MISLIWTVLLVAAVCAGCGGAAKSPADDTYHPETDYQYWLNQNSVYHNVAETKEGLYIDTPQALLFADTQSWVTVPVCSRPECPHDIKKWTGKSGDYDCQAYFPGGLMGGTPCVAGERLYMCYRDVKRQQYVVSEVSVSESKRIELFYLDKGQSPGCFLVHRGKAYLTVWETVVEEDISVDGGIWEYDLSSPGGKGKLIFDRKAQFGNAQKGLQDLLAYGDHLYFLDYDDVEKGSSAAYMLDLKTYEVTKLPMQEDDGSTNGLIIAGGRILLTRYPFTEDGGFELDKTVMLSFAPDGSDAKMLGPFPSGLTTADDRYLYQYDMDAGSIRVYDPDLALVREIPDDSFAGGNERVIMICIFPTKGDNILLDVQKIDMPTGNIIHEYAAWPRSAVPDGEIALRRLFGSVTENGSYSLVY